MSRLGSPQSECADFLSGPPLMSDADVRARQRRQRLIERLDQLAYDAQLEECDLAAALLRDAAERMRTAILSDAWTSSIALAAAEKPAARGRGRAARANAC